MTNTKMTKTKMTKTKITQTKMTKTKKKTKRKKEEGEEAYPSQVIMMRPFGRLQMPDTATPSSKSCVADGEGSNELAAPVAPCLNLVLKSSHGFLRSMRWRIVPCNQSQSKRNPSPPADMRSRGLF